MVYFAQSLKIKSMNRLIMKKMVRKKITWFIGSLAVGHREQLLSERSKGVYPG